MLRAISLLLISGSLFAQTTVINGWGGGGGGGSVNSVGLSAPGFFTVGGTPVSTSGTLTLSYGTGLTANQILGTNGSGAAGLMALTTSQLPFTLPLSVANGGTGTTTPAITAGTNITVTGTWPNVTINATAGGAGTVTSVGFTGGLLSVANPTSTPAFTVAGTSGGIPYFSSASTWATSGALTANGVVLGGGAGASPTVTASDSTTTHALFATAGAPAFRAIASGDIPTLNQNTTGSAASFTGSLVGDVSGTQGATVVGKINGVALSGLSTGILKNTTATGVPSIAVAGDFPTLNQNTTGTAANVTGTVAVANGGTGTTTPAIVAGTNVTVSGTWPNQTINATAQTPTTFTDFPQKSYIPAANCNATAAGAGWSLPSSSAAVAACHTGTNVNDGYLQFADAQTAQFTLLLPDDWDSASSLDIRMFFTDASTSGTVIMQAATSCTSTAGALADDVAFNTAQSLSTVTLATTASVGWITTLTGLTKTGCSAGNFLHIKVLRGTDTAAGVANVSGAQLTMRRTF